MTYIKLFFLAIFTLICSILATLFLIDRSHTLYIWLSRFFSKGILLISGIKLNVTGIENIKKDQSYVYVSNHSSQYDIPAMQLSVPTKMSIVFKKEIAKVPIFGWQMQFGPYIMVDRKKAESAMKSIEEAKKMIQKGFSILLFAEGTRSKTGEVQPFKRGAFYLASRVGHPIIPVSLSGTEKIMPKGSMKINPGTINVHYGNPIEITGALSRKEEIELMEKVREIVIQNKKGN